MVCQLSLALLLKAVSCEASMAVVAYSIVCHCYSCNVTAESETNGQVRLIARSGVAGACTDMFHDRALSYFTQKRGDCAETDQKHY